MRYTDYMEDKLPWDSYDEENDDYQSLIDLMNSEDFFRSFGDGLLSFMQEQKPDLTAETAIAYIEACCAETGVPVGDIRSTNALKNWFKGGPRPKKGEDSRSSMFALAFALQLTPERTKELFHKVYLDRAFDYRNEKEIIYYFCLQNKKSWADAIRLIESSQSMDTTSNDYTIYTAQIETDIDAMADEASLLSYIAGHGNNLRKNNLSAKNTKDELIEKALVAIEQETGLITQRNWAEQSKMRKKVREDEEDDSKRENALYTQFPTLSHFADCSAHSLNHIYEVITDCSVRGTSGTKTLFKNARLPKEIQSRFPEAHTLSKKEPTYEELRKLIILLASYNCWLQAQKKGISIKEYYEDDINAYLDQSKLPRIYYGNPYDWLFMYCSRTARPLDTFRGILAEVLDEE